jgi:hypothetical protein
MLASSQPLLVRQAQLRSRARAVVFGIAAYGVIAPLLAVAHELIVLGTAHLVGDFAWLVATGGLLRAVPLDPIYTSAMLLTLGGIEPRGLALAGPPGALLHAQWPGLIESPTLVASQAWASAIVAPGSTVVSRWLCGIAADATLVAIGIVAMRRSHGGRPWLAVFGAIVQAHVVVTHLIELPPDLAEVEAAGIPFAVAMLVSGDVQAGPRLAETLEGLVDPVQGAVLGLGMVVLAYLPVFFAILSWRLVRGTRHLIRTGHRSHIGAWPVLLLRRLRRFGLNTVDWRLAPTGLGRVVALTTLAVAVALSPLGDLADAQTRFLAVSLDAEPIADEPRLSPVSPTDPVPSGDASSVPMTIPSGTTSPASVVTPAPVSEGPSIVAVTGSGYRYQYTVNGIPQVIRGIGYNVRYRLLPDEQRARLLDRDFAALKEAGVNTVFGWEPREFDTVLLDTAYRHGLGVAPPFELDPEANYADPAVREQITTDALAWVAKHREHPALRMWAIGNEVLHKLVYPSWMPVRSDPAWERRARDFSSFYVELIDRVHAADPNHPIVHRDAEDAYLTWMRDALQASGRRPWFIYGVNAYTPRLAEILTSWPSQGWDVPLLVSEFAPGGMSPADRPEGFRSMWKMIRGANGWVLGGAVYAWTTDGPEEVDRVFGLVDAAGNPVDGAFATIGSFYRGVARQSEAGAVRPGQVDDERVWSFARKAIVAIQAGKSAQLLPATADTSIMGDVNAVAQAPSSEVEMVVQQVHDPRRVAWARDIGVTGEWWVTWLPPSTPHRKLTFVVQERQDGGLGVGYIYHGPR